MGGNTRRTCAPPFQPIGVALTIVFWPGWPIKRKRESSAQMSIDPFNGGAITPAGAAAALTGVHAVGSLLKRARQIFEGDRRERENIDNMIRQDARKRARRTVIGPAKAVPFVRGKRTRVRNFPRNINFRQGGFEGLELKFIDTSYWAVNLNDTANMTGLETDPATKLCLNSVAQGSGASERIGRKQRLKSVYIAGTVDIEGSAATGAMAPPTVSIYLVLDTQTNLAQLNSEDVFEGVSATTMTAMPLRNLENSQRFRVLRKLTIAFPQPTMIARSDGTNGVEYQNGTNIPFEIYKPLHNLLVNYKDAGGNVTSITDNSLHVIAMKTVNSQPVRLNYSARVRYTL